MWSSLTEGANCIRWRSLLRSRGREERPITTTFIITYTSTWLWSGGAVVRESGLKTRSFPLPLSAAWRSRLGQNQAQASCRAREIDKIQVRAGKPSADEPGGSCDGLARF